MLNNQIKVTSILPSVKWIWSDWSHLNALELCCNMIASPGVAEPWSMKIVMLMVVLVIWVMTFVVLVMTYVCMDINGVSNAELGLPGPVDGGEPVKVTLHKKSKWHWSKMQIWIQEHWKEAPFLWHLEIQITWSYLALPWMVMNPMSWEKRGSLMLEHKITESLWNSRHQCHQYNVTKSIFQYLHLQSEEECKK